MKQWWGSLLFVFYCMSVGAYLVVRPWAPDPKPASIPLRVLVCAVGLVHVAAGVRDFLALLRRLSASSAPPRS